MALPTLPVIGEVPSIGFFQRLEWLALLMPVLAFLVATIVSSGVLIGLRLYKDNKSPKQRQPNSCRRCMNSLFLFVGRRLCVYTFPALFKMHKTHSGYGKPTRSFMVFLDRKVENSLILVTAFCFIVCSILCSSTMVFLRYFPVEVSRECLEKDSHGQSLFCYSNSSLINSSLPVDCANFSLTELREFQFQCYAIAPPTSLGIAVAAALGLAKVAIVGVTIFVKVTEGFFNMTKNPPRKLQEVCCCNRVTRKCANRIYSALSNTFLLTMSAIVPLFGLTYAAFDADSPVLYKLYYLAYTSLPSLINIPLTIVIISFIKTHCDKGEYISIAADMRPLDQRDWDVESETDGEHDEASTGGERNIINNEPPDPCELDVESESEVENDEPSNAGQSCIIIGEVPNETQEMGVQFHDINSNTEECTSQI